jgi:hypothetical protein
MGSFVVEGPPERIVFGAGTIAAVPAELDRLGATRALVLCTPQQAELADRVAGLLGPQAVGRFDQAAMHTPVAVTDVAIEHARSLDADAVVFVGGGSTTGLGKAVASRLGVAHLVLPTTYAGSEVTPVLGETRDGAKTTRSAPGRVRAAGPDPGARGSHLARRARLRGVGRRPGRRAGDRPSLSQPPPGDPRRRHGPGSAGSHPVGQHRRVPRRHPVDDRPRERRPVVPAEAARRQRS